MVGRVASRYPSANGQYTQAQMDQMLKTLIGDLNRIGQVAGVGYAPGAYAPDRQLLGGGRTFATASLGVVTVAITTSGVTDTAVTVNSGQPDNTYNTAQVVAALITDFMNRGMLG
jgi:hypothetical protein